jgi:hypothetical protein
MKRNNLLNLFGRQTSDTNDTQQSKGLSLGVLNWLSILIGTLGIFIVLLFGASYSAKATIFLWMLACLLSGTAIGFLFGIPKILQNSQGSGNAAPIYQQQVNTNLTEISDWLTKIIVGLGLVNLIKIPPYLSKVAKILAGGLTLPPNQLSLAMAFAYGIIISYVILGFLLGYITTRLYLAGAFSRADQEALQTLTRQAQEAVGAARSALQKVDFALISPTDISTGVNLRPEAELEQLSNEYVQIRATMPSGDLRTHKMAEIFKKMTTIASTTQSLDVPQLLIHNDPGKRLVAYAYLYSKPDYQYFRELVDAIVTDQTPFGQYWGIQALKKIIESRPHISIEHDIAQKIRTYYKKLPKGIDREYELSKILSHLKN